MRSVLKGPLLSGLVFPGAGQLIQKNKVRGWCYILLAVLCVVIFFRVITAQISQVADMVTSGEVGTDTAALTEAVTTNMANSGGLASVAVKGLIVVWAVALVDAIVTGIKQDRNSNGAST